MGGESKADKEASAQARLKAAPRPDETAKRRARARAISAANVRGTKL